MKKTIGFRIGVFLTIHFLANTAISQPGYEINRRTDAQVIAGGFSIAALGFYVDHKVAPLTTNEIDSLYVQNINIFDRSTTYNWSPTLDRTSDVLLFVLGISPASLLLSNRCREDSYTMPILYSETMLYSLGSNFLCKGLVKRERPYVYNKNVPVIEKTKTDARKSFYSGHTTLAFASAVFTSELYSRYYPDSKWSDFVWASSLTMASAVGYLRYKSGMHFPTDVIVGALMGSLTGYIIPHLHETNHTDHDHSHLYDSNKIYHISVTFCF